MLEMLEKQKPTLENAFHLTSRQKTLCKLVSMPKNARTDETVYHLGALHPDTIRIFTAPLSIHTSDLIRVDRALMCLCLIWS